MMRLRIREQNNPATSDTISGYTMRLEMTEIPRTSTAVPDDRIGGALLPKGACKKLKIGG